MKTTKLLRKFKATDTENEKGWKHHSEHFYYVCGNCGWETGTQFETFKFCPMCGFKLNGMDDDKTATDILPMYVDNIRYYVRDDTRGYWLSRYGYDSGSMALAMDDYIDLVNLREENYLDFHKECDWLWKNRDIYKPWRGMRRSDLRDPQKVSETADD